MRLQLALLIFFIGLTGTNIAQEKDSLDCSICLLSGSTEISVENYLTARKLMIRMILHVDGQYKKDSVFINAELPINNNSNDSCIIFTQTIDSIIIELDNGISWNLETGPPKKPKRFNSRMLTMKNHEDQEVFDRIHYLQFCSRFEKGNSSPCNVLDTYKVYTKIKHKEVDVFKAEYNLDIENHQVDFLKLEQVESN